MSAGVVAESVQFALVGMPLTPFSMFQPKESWSETGATASMSQTPVTASIIHTPYIILLSCLIQAVMSLGKFSLSLYQAKANKTHRTGSELSQLFGVTSKAIRDVWNLRSWQTVTKPYWSEHDRQKYENSLTNARERAASDAPCHDASPWCSSTLGGCNVSAGNLSATLLPQMCEASASTAFGKQADISKSIDASNESSSGIYRQPQLKRPRHSLRTAIPESSADDLMNAECHQECLPSAKFQRAVQRRSAWSNLVKVSTATSFEGAQELLCFIDSSYSRFHLFDDASSSEVLNCPLDNINLRACSGKPGTDTVVAVALHTTSATAAITLYISRTATSQVRVLSTTSRVPVGIYTGTRGELLTRVLTHFLGSRTTH